MPEKEMRNTTSASATQAGDANKQTADTGFRTAFGVAIVAGVFTLVVTAMIAISFFQTVSAPPLTSTSVQVLINQLHDQPEDNALKAEIRAFDLMARKAYFTSVSFRRNGAFLLLGAIAVLLLALKSMARIRHELPDPRTYSPVATEDDAVAARWFVVGTVILMLIVALVMAGLFRNELNPAPAPAAPTLQASQPTALAPVVQHDASKPKDVIVSPPPDALALAQEQQMQKQWPFFRGPNSLGVAQYTNAPTSWDGKSGKNILWHTALTKPGMSSPIVWGKRLFLTAGDRVAREVECFDADTGNFLWQTQVKDIPGSPVGREDDGLPSTPAPVKASSKGTAKATEKQVAKQAGVPKSVPVVDAPIKKPEEKDPHAKKPVGKAPAPATKAPAAKKTAVKKAAKPPVAKKPAVKKAPAKKPAAKKAEKKKHK